MSNTMLKFKYGDLNTLKNQPCAPGTIYVTQDERALYIDLPGAKSKNDRIRIGDMQSYKNKQELENAIKTNGLGMLTKTALYFVKEDNNGDTINALYKYDETSNEFIRLNDVSSITGDLNSITEAIGEIQTDIDNLQKDVEDIYSVSQNDQGNVVKSGYLIDEIEAAKTELQGKIDGKVNTATHQELQETVSGLSGSFTEFKAAYETDSGALEGRVKDNEDDIKKLQDYTDSLKNGDNSIANLISNAVAVETGNRTTAIEGLNALITGNQNAIAALEQPIADLDNELDQLTKKHDAYETSNNAALDAVRATANGAVQKTDYDTKILALEGDISTNTQAIAKLETDIGTNADNITVVTNKVNAFLNAPETQEEVIDTLLEIQQYITKDTNAFTQLSQTVEGLDTTKASKNEVAAETTAREEAIQALQDEILAMLSWKSWDSTSNEPEEV